MTLIPITPTTPTQHSHQWLRYANGVGHARALAAAEPHIFGTHHESGNGYKLPVSVNDVITEALHENNALRNHVSINGSLGGPTRVLHGSATVCSACPSGDAFTSLTAFAEAIAPQFGKIMAPQERWFMLYGSDRSAGLLTAPRQYYDRVPRPDMTLNYTLPRDPSHRAIMGALGKMCKANANRDADCWIMNIDTLEHIVGKLEGPAPRPKLLGHHVIIVPEMPEFAPGKTPVLFGNFHKAYELIDDPRTECLRDAYTRRPFTYFLAERRIWGMVTDPTAYKALEVM